MILGILTCMMACVIINIIIQLVVSAFNEYMDDSNYKKNEK